MTAIHTGGPVSDRTFPLLPEQRRFLGRGLPGAHHWNQARLFHVPDAVGVAQVRAAVLAVVNRHSSLRMGLRAHDDSEIGVLSKPLDGFPVEEHDLRDVPPTEQSAVLTERATAIQGSMTLTGAPLVRVACFTLSGGQRRLLLVVHHFVCDGLSFGIVVSDLDKALHTAAVGDVWDPGPAPFDVTEYADWLLRLASEGTLDEQLDLWRRIGRPAAPVPIELPGVNSMADTATVEAELDSSATTELLESVLPRLRASVKDVFLAAAVGALQGTGAERSLRTNLIGHGRRGLPGQPNLARSVGWLSTRYPVAVTLDTTKPFEDQVSETNRQLSAIPFDGAGFGVLRYLHPADDVREALADLGEPDITVNYLGRFEAPAAMRVLQPAAESPGPDETETGMREHLHGIDVLVVENRLRVVWYYNTTQYRPQTIEGHAVELLDRVRKGLGL